MFPMLYTAASGLVAGEKALDVTASNLANVTTPAYRPERPLFASYLGRAVARASAGTPASPVEVDVRGTWDAMRPGPLKSTGNPLDLAIEGEGWFRVGTPAGERLTRAGSLQLDAEGRLVTPDGHPLLDELGNPVVVPAGSRQVEVAQDGTVSVDGEQVAILGLVTAPPGTLRREGNSLWQPTAGVTPLPPERVRIRQGFLEQSGVSATEELVRMIGVQRLFELQERVVHVAANVVASEAVKLGDVVR